MHLVHEKKDNWIDLFAVKSRPFMKYLKRNTADIHHFSCMTKVSKGGVNAERHIKNLSSIMLIKTNCSVFQGIN